MNRLAISVTEFGHMLHACRPPGGWGRSIAVAHSGGADSTCLVYLIHSWLSRQGAHEGPSRMLCLSVDHSLQPRSSEIANHCRQFCEEHLHTPSQILRIPWSRPPYPDRPGSNAPIESIARKARYHLLFQAMKDNHASVIAMGHHADDQVETLIMRLARTGATGNLVGIRRCRRWGMGSSPKGLDWAGSSGMYHWIIRPLLTVPKDRILATCELHGLHYINDPTNFQPLLTPRNLVRHSLSGQSIDEKDLVGQPKVTHHDVGKVKQAISELDAIGSANTEVSKMAPLVARLRTAASHISHLQDRIDDQVTRYLMEFRRPSAPSTLLLLNPSEGFIPTKDVQRAVVLRILRYVSPKPWGAPESESLRRSVRLRRICDHLWNSTEPRRAFCGGSEVMWTPVSLGTDNRKLSVLVKNDGRTSGDRLGWLASRQPPIQRTCVSSPCMRDISHLLAHDAECELLWDNRYVVTLRPHLLSPELLDSCRSGGLVTIAPHGKWLLPKIVWLRAKEDEVLLGGVGVDVQKTWEGFINSAWVDFRWIRSSETI